MDCWTAERLAEKTAERRAASLVEKTADEKVMVRTMEFLSAVMKAAKTTMAERKAVRLAEETVHVMVRVMDC
jgi:uncharacterized protein (DUF1778 family)